MRKSSTSTFRKWSFYSTTIFTFIILVSFQNCGKVKFTKPQSKVGQLSCPPIIMSPSTNIKTDTEVSFEIVPSSGTTVSSLNWEFSKSQVSVFSSTANPTLHTFSVDGSYEVSATFDLSDGTKCIESEAFSVNTGDVCPTPTGINGPSIGNVGVMTAPPFSVSFESCFVGSVEWDMDSDGTVDYTTNGNEPVSFIYDSEGTFIVKATVTNSEDSSKTVLTHPIVITYKSCINPFTNQVVPNGQSVEFAKPDLSCGSKPCLKSNRFCENGSFGEDFSYTLNPATCPVSNACPAPINGSCGTTNNSCVTGTLSDITDSGTQFLWNCNGANGGTNASCSLNKPVNGSCGTTNNSCVAGTLSDTADSGTQYLWSCNGSNGGTNASCSLTKPVVVNGSCGTTNNSCVTGTLSDKTDTASQYLWSCNGSNGGTNASCSLNKPVNGSCGTTNNSCVTGTLSDKTDTATQYLWSCNGSNGGTNASCSLNKPVNGSCGTTNNSCVTGTLSDKTDTATQYLWSCNGSNGGTNASCSKNKPINGSCGTVNNSCVSGALSDTADSGTQYLWSCLGSNGGTNASCALNKPTYSWSIGAWGACSATACGTTGTHTRTVVCKQNNGNTVADSFCTGTKPVTSQACSAPACTCGIQNTSGPCEVEYWCSGVYKKTVNPVTVASVIDPANVIYNPGQTINGFSSPGYTTLINNYSYICNAQGNWQSNTSNGYCKLRKDDDSTVCTTSLNTCSWVETNRDYVNDGTCDGLVGSGNPKPPSTPCTFANKGDQGEWAGCKKPNLLTVYYTCTCGAPSTSCISCNGNGWVATQGCTAWSPTGACSICTPSMPIWCSGN